METARKIPNFQGSFRTLRVNYNINREKSTVDRFVVFSSGKRQSIVRYLWLKLVWDELSKLEFELFLSMPEVLSNNKILGFLRSRLKLDKRILRQRLLYFENLLEGKSSSRLSYQGIRRMKIDIQKEQIKLPRTTKFSGYVRNVSSIGRSKGGAVLPEPVSVEYIEDYEESHDWYDLLSVGEITLLSQVYVLPEEDQQVRNGIINNLKPKFK